MPICQRCGASIARGAARCPLCGYTSFLDDPLEPPPATPPPRDELPLAMAAQVGRIRRWALIAALTPPACWLVAILLIQVIPDVAKGGFWLFVSALAVLLAVIGRHAWHAGLLVALALFAWSHGMAKQFRELSRVPPASAGGAGAKVDEPRRDR